MKRSIVWFAICARRSRPAMRNNIGKYAATIAWPVLVTALILVAWELSVRALGIRSIILPPPSAVFETMAQRHDLLFAHLWPSLYLTVLGFVLSVIGGIIVAVLITYSAIVRKGFYPVIVVSQVIPKISIAPLFIVWFGTGTMSSLLLAFLVAFFPMTINAAMGFESIDEDIHRMAHLHGLALADLLEDPHAQRIAVYLRRHEDFHHAGHHRRHRVGVRRVAGRNRLFDQARRRFVGHSADAGGDRRAEHQRARPLCDHRRGGKLGRLLAAATRGGRVWRRMMRRTERSFAASPRKASEG